MKRLFLPVLPPALLGCQKSTLAPANRLPPATQTGANTFGFLANGQPWTPSGNNGRSNFQVDYDPTWYGGSLQIKVYRYTGAGNNVLQGLTLGAVNVTQPGVYTFPLGGLSGIGYSDFGVPAPQSYFSSSHLTYQRGTLTLTRFDPVRGGLVAGTFAFTLAQPGCDTLRITQGRFDTRF